MKEETFTLKSGDILFQDMECGPLCIAIKKVTEGYNGAGFSHVGVVIAEVDTWVIEAISKGVVKTPLQDFLNRSSDDQGKPKVIVGRVKKEYSSMLDLAMRELKKYIGYPYDDVFLMDEDKVYCSEMIYHAFYKANNNKPFFQLFPMTFNDPETGEIFPVWKEYYYELQKEVPEGLPGINPGSLSRSEKIEIVHAYGYPEGWKDRE